MRDAAFRTPEGAGPRQGARRLAFAVMVVVTGWSIWAWAQPKPAHTPEHAPQPQHAPQEETANEQPAPINWFEFGTETPPFIAMVVNFGILAAGYYLFGRKPIAAALQSRRDSIAKEIQDAQKMRQEAEERAKTYQAKLDRLEEEVRTARDALVRAGEAERERIVGDAEAKAERLRKDAQFLVEQELKQIRQDLWRDALDAAVAAAEELLRRGVTQADQDRL
ncbi:MAG TPA: ATP synthase F0 subunit B, partial [Polyangiaceae bacterium]|nr:ATP synthase F0 subunit B [Polyangiaceae bacterium]